jgi:lipoate-protein ligase A
LVFARFRDHSSCNTGDFAVMPLCETLQILDERAQPGAAAWNMALDEALLEVVEVPLLRFYRWEQPAVSFGYFLPVTEAETAARGRELVRRWTGGGIVEHGEDSTWSLIVPASHEVSRLRPVESYVKFHAALANALPEDAGVVQVGPETPAPATGLCMVSPAPGDLMRHGKKIAGAGQRRCRYGLLHQGSICGIALPDDFPVRLAAVLSAAANAFPESRYPRAAAERLAAERYGSTFWLHRR